MVGNKEIFNSAGQPDVAVLNRLVGLGSMDVSMNVVMELQQKTIEMRFEDSKQNFTVLFAEVPDPAAAFTVLTTHGAAQLLRTLRNVQTLCTGSVSRMTIDLGVLDTSTLHELVEIPCEELIVKGFSECIPNEEVAEALNKIRATRDYCIESDIGCKILPTHLPSQKLSLKFASGVTTTDLLNIAGKTANIELLDSSLTSEDVHEFVKTWFESREITTVSLRVTKKNQETWDVQQVLLGIQYAPWLEWMRDRSFVTGRTPESGFPESAKDMGLAMDIDRADRVIGLIGSVLITRNELFFGVWHNRHEIEAIIPEYRMKFHSAEERAWLSGQEWIREFKLLGFKYEKSPFYLEWLKAVQEFLRAKHDLQTLLQYSQSFGDDNDNYEFL